MTMDMCINSLLNIVCVWRLIINLNWNNLFCMLVGCSIASCQAMPSLDLLAFLKAFSVSKEVCSDIKPVAEVSCSRDAIWAGSRKCHSLFPARSSLALKLDPLIIPIFIPCPLPLSYLFTGESLILRRCFRLHNEVKCLFLTFLCHT